MFVLVSHQPSPAFVWRSRPASDSCGNGMSTLPTPPSLTARIEEALRLAMVRATGPVTPPRLRDALEHAVFPGGARLRPQLCLLAAISSGDVDPATANAAAAAIELLHCASLVHDDLPCFDDADTRRGVPTVHKVFGEPTALLVGDALLVHAFEELGRTASAGPLVLELSRAAGALRGIIAGQAWEQEPAAPLEEYHRAKTASLFEAAAAMGALASHADPAPWRRFGELIGRAYQAADDLADALPDSAAIGKPTGRDQALDRPSVVRALGVEGARRSARLAVDEALASVPPGRGAHLVTAWLERLASRIGVR